LPPNSRFCNKCAAPVRPAATAAEYKQVTVLFADVVHSMDIAAAVGAERLREIMTELVERSAVVVQRFGGTVDKFTATASWRCLAHQWRWKITLFAPAWPR
jgi:adenylate cyclase